MVTKVDDRLPGFVIILEVFGRLNWSAMLDALHRRGAAAADAVITMRVSRAIADRRFGWAQQAGRLQTQHIMLSAAQPGVEMQLTDVPAAVQLEQPFMAAISLCNNLDQRLGPLQISYSALPSGRHHICGTNWKRKIEAYGAWQRRSWDNNFVMQEHG